MRILKIRSWLDFGEFCLDQVGHAAIVDLAVIWFARDWRDVVQAGAVILTIREGEQGRRTVKEWRKARAEWAEGEDARVRVEDGRVVEILAVKPDALKLLEDLHLADRVADVFFGTLLAAGFFQVCRALGWV